MANTGIKRIKDLTLEELETFVESLENMCTVANRQEMREQILKTVQQVKREIAKRIKNL